VQPQHPLIEKLVSLYRVARSSSQPADVHDQCAQIVNELGAFIDAALKPKAEAIAGAAEPIPGPGSVKE
jgi:hypothetical protein